MNIRINKLTLTNFKCFRYKEFTFTDYIVNISGRNGSGKTTIADAVLYCLFGKNSQGQTNFDLKTHDEQGEVIPHLDHSVEMVLDVDGVHNTLKRTLKEKWVKRRGTSEHVFAGNDFEYMVNGDAVTASDYKKYIASLISEDVFRTITNPTYFPSLKWQAQRDFLSKLAGNISPESVAGNDQDLLSFIKTLEQNGNDITAYRKHLSYQIKQVKEKIDKIPVRLEELTKAMPEKADWNTVLKEYDDAAIQVNDIRKKIAEATAGNTSDVKRAELRKQLNELSKQQEWLENNIRESIRESQRDLDRCISNSRKEFAETNRTIVDLGSKIASYDRLVERCNETLKQCESDADDIRREWKDNEAARLVIPDNATVCPTCGQPLPQDQVEALVEKIKLSFSEKKKLTKERLTERAAKVKQLMADAEAKINEYHEQKKEDEANLKNLKESLNAIQKQLHACASDKVPSFDDTCKNDLQYVDVLRKIESVKSELENITTDEDSKQLVEGLKIKEEEYITRIKELSEQLASKSQYDRISEMIDDVKKEESQFIATLSELEQQEDIAIQYQDRQNSLLEESINKHFKLVQWKLFRTVVNGGDSYQEPYCECYVDGTAYHDGLNQAAQINAGLDICETLSKINDAYAPIIVDNAESNLNIYQTTGQQLRLIVSDNDLRVF